jgi:hypothetical protein
MSKVDLHLAMIPDDPNGRLETCLNLYRKLTGKEPTAEDIAAARRTLGLPPLPG